MNLLGKKFSHDLAHRTGERLLTSPLFLVSATDPDTRTHTLGLFRATPPGVSFTDCLVMATADKYETQEIFGFDEIFRKKGYRVPAHLDEAA
jgi:predicted nucleic acid-binding protein